MLKEVFTFLITDTGIKLIEFMVMIFVAYVTAKFTAKNTKRSLTTQYFKEKGIESQEKVLTFWSNLFLNGFRMSEAYKVATNNCKKMSDVEIITEMHQESYIYCSRSTIRAIREYQQFIYNQKYKSKGVDFSFFVQLVLITRIISKMKYDFTGEKVDELDIIKIKINDFKIKFRLLCRLLLIYYYIKEKFLKILIFSIVVILLLFKLLKWF